MERKPPPLRTPGPLTPLERAIPLLILLCGAAFGPVYAITVSKLNVTNTYASSTNQKVSVYGLPPLSLSSPASAYTTEPYNQLTYAPYPYSTSANTRATFKLSSGTISNGEMASSTLSTFDPAAALTISDWAFWGGATGNTRLGAVPDPSVSREAGPSSPGGGTGPGDWISLNITFRNALKPLETSENTPLSELPRPSSRLAYPDFGVGAYLAARPRIAEIDVERYYSQRAILKVNPNSQGNLAQAFDLLRSSSSGFIANGQSSADDGTSATLFVPPVVLLPGQTPPSPSPSEPVTAHFLRASPGVQDTFRTISARRILTHLTLAPGATITFQVRVLLGAFDGFNIGTGQPIDAFRPLFISRMREITVQNGVEITEAAFSGVTDYPRDIQSTPLAPEARPWTSATPAPLDRQDWAHRLDLYNRALQYHGGTTATGNGNF